MFRGFRVERFGVKGAGALVGECTQGSFGPLDDFKVCPMGIEPLQGSRAISCQIP